MVKLELTNRTEEINGTRVGSYALDHQTGEITFVRWTTLYRKENSYAISASLLEKIDSSKIYCVDKNSDRVYLFLKSDYEDGPMEKTEWGFQYTLDRTEAVKSWDSLDDILMD